MVQQHVRLNAGIDMPLVGLGILNRERPELTPNAVRTALEAGYRLLDTASVYNNEQEVGDALQASGLKRTEVFVTTKLWIGHFGYDSALKGFDGSLRRLGLDYVDLYLLHWPYPERFDLTVASYRAAARLYGEGRIKAIGVSNFKPHHIERLLEHVDIVPAVNQVELHPFFAQRELRQFHAGYGIVTEAWSPLGNTIGRSASRTVEHAPLEHPLIARLAEKYGKSPVQIILRWHIQNGIVAIPKSATPSRIRANIEIFDFELSAEDLHSIDTLDTGERFSRDPDIVVPGTYPTTVID